MVRGVCMPPACDERAVARQAATTCIAWVAACAGRAQGAVLIVCVPPPCCPAVLKELEAAEKLILDGDEFYLAC